MTYFLTFLAGVVVGVIYHATLQPYVTRAWLVIKSKFGG